MFDRLVNATLSAELQRDIKFGPTAFYYVRVGDERMNISLTKLFSDLVFGDLVSYGLLHFLRTSGMSRIYHQ